MIGVFKASFFYALAALALTASLNHDLLGTVYGLLGAALVLSHSMVGVVAQIWWVVPLALVLLGPRRCLDRLTPIALVTVASLMLQIGFLFAKSAIPQLMPFYADPALLALDRALLFGHDAWQLAHAITPHALVGWFPTFYMPAWSVIAFALPVAIIATDPDEARAARFVWIFFGAWVVAGNVAATLGSSVGPIYVDRLVNGTHFAELHAALAQSGFAQSPLGQLQERLWAARNLQDGITFSGISAFPSMHVAVATVAALYLQERSRWLAPLGWIFFALIALISVYSGYHYLSDSLVGFAMVWSANALWKRRATRASAPDAIALAAE